MRLMFRHEGTKVGGVDLRRKHWYIAKGFAIGKEDLVRCFGFDLHTERSGHRYWRLDGTDNYPRFRAAVEGLVGKQS